MDYTLPDNSVNLENLQKVETRDIKLIKTNKRRLHPRDSFEYPYDGTLEYQTRIYYFKVNNEWFDGYTYVAYWENKPAFLFSIDVGEINYNSEDEPDINSIFRI